MFRNYLKTGFRNLKGNLTFTLLNILSLVIGSLVVYLAIGYLNFENSYDRFHENSEDLYRVVRTQRSQDYATIGFAEWSQTSAEDQLRQIQVFKEINGVEDASQFIISNEPEFLRYKNIDLEQDDVLITNTPESFSEMFSWRVLSGSLKNFSTIKNSVIINESTAKKITSGSIQELINQTVEIADKHYTISAVIKDVPKNSHFDFQIAISEDQIPYWGSNLYLQLSENANPKTVLQQFNRDILKANPNLAESDTYKGHYLQKITDIHLNSNILYELKTPGNPTYIYLISAFGILIILITLFNYTNFTIAIKTKQSRTIGIRKVLGASNKAIAVQFLMEAILLVFFTLPVLVLCLILVLPEFNRFMKVGLASNPLFDLNAMTTILLMLILFGILASIAPIIILAPKKIPGLFKDKLNDKKFETFSIRKFLIISQIAILIGVSSVSYFMYQQITYIQDKDLGFQKDGVLYAYSSPESLELFQQELKSIPEITYVGNGSIFGIEQFNQLEYKLEGQETIFDDSNQFYLDYEAIKAYDLKTNLSQSIFEKNDRKNRTLINKSAAERFSEIKGIRIEELIGTKVITEPSYQNEDGSYGIPFTIDGFYEDINAFSLKESIKPYFITVSDRVRMGGTSIISYNPDQTERVIRKIKKAYANLDNSYPLKIEFLDKKYEQLHDQEVKTANLIFTLNAIAVILASIGITGISLLLIVGRKKEIGIRKVLGASVIQILRLSVREYGYFVLIGLLVSTPVAWWIIKKWLNNFAYSISIQPWVFMIAALLVLILSGLIVSIVSYKAALTNPVKSLKTE
ncbi:MAG: FtsX-like permease family protein [Christiangramia sp.]|uniref:ABC transporter permease n=1 Tax=Christiangramia sp. TaxID=1931228 RepID=UPI0032420561